MIREGRYGIDGDLGEAGESYSISLFTNNIRPSPPSSSVSFFKRNECFHFSPFRAKSTPHPYILALSYLSISALFSKPASFSSAGMDAAVGLYPNFGRVGGRGGGEVG